MMHKYIKLAIGLTLAATSLSAQSGFVQAPVPGPYLVMRPLQKPAMPAFTPQRFAMPMPYWMKNTQPRQPQAQAQQQPQTQTQSQPAVGRATQQPLNTGVNAPASNRNTPTPGFFPGYNTGQPQNAPRPQQPPTANYGTPYPANNYAPMPWGQGGQQGFMPMQAPWQNGQNGWGNNWNNNGYGYQQGYAAPGRARQ